MNIKESKLDIKWWESKRWIFNVLVGLCGVLGIIRGINSWGESIFIYSDLIGIILWGILANILFSTGILMEIFDNYYFNNKLKMRNFRLTFLIIGTIIYCIVTYSYAWTYYSNFILW